MARRGARKASNEASNLELFPFLSVVACTLGSLVLLIIIIALQIGSDARQLLLSLPGTEQETQISQNPLLYVECREEAIVLYPGSREIPKEEIDRFNSEIANFLEEAKQDENTIIYFLIRPSGVSVFDRMRNIVEQENINLRYEPIGKDWQLDA